MKQALVAVVALCCAVPETAHAHNRLATYSVWELSEHGASVRVKVPLVAIAAFSQGQLVMTSTAGPCSASRPTRFDSRDGWVHLSWTVRCPDTPTGIESALLSVVPGHLHFASVTGPGIGRIDAVLSEASPTVPLTEPEPPSRLRYLPLGVQHVLSGWDHLAFVLLLVLVAVSTREVLALVTGFTVGHSLTLGLAAMGYVVPDLRAVEILIAVSIVAVAVENVWLNTSRRSPWVPIGLCAGIVALSVAGSVPLVAVALSVLCYFALLTRVPEPRRLRWGFATLFGLIHGFGFAAVLTEGGAPLTLGNLFAFNVGVEIGQVVVVLLALPLFFWLTKNGFRRATIAVGSAMGAGIGVYATLVRAFG